MGFSEIVNNKQQKTENGIFQNIQGRQLRLLTGFLFIVIRAFDAVDVHVCLVEVEREGLLPVTRRLTQQPLQLVLLLGHLRAVLL